MKVCRGQV